MSSNRDVLSSISGNIWELKENIESNKLASNRIRNELSKIADSLAVLAGTMTKDEVLIRKELERLEYTRSWVTGYTYEERKEKERLEHILEYIDKERIKVIVETYNGIVEQ